MNHLPLLKSLGVNTRNLKPNSELYKGAPSNTYSYTNASMWAFTVDPKTLQIEVNTKYYYESKQMKRYNTIIFNKYNKFKRRNAELIDWSLKSAKDMNIHQKVNANNLDFRSKYWHAGMLSN